MQYVIDILPNQQQKTAQSASVGPIVNRFCASLVDLQPFFIRANFSMCFNFLAKFAIIFNYKHRVHFYDLIEFCFL